MIEPQPLKEWQSKLAYLQVALAQASDPTQKFGLEQQIAEAEGWVAKLSKQSWISCRGPPMWAAVHPCASLCHGIG